MLSLAIEAVFDSYPGAELYAVALADSDDVGAAASTGDITVAGTAGSNGILSIYIAGRRVRVTVTEDDTATAIATAIAAAINADLDLPVTATSDTGTVTLTAKWLGASGDQITVRLNVVDGDEDEVPDDVVLTVEDLDEGAIDPDIDDALDLLGEFRITTIAMPYTDSTSIGKVVAKGDELSSPEIKRQFVAFIGYNGYHSDFLTTVADYNSQWISFVPVSGSASSPWLIASAAAARAARNAQVDPARPARTSALVGIRPATESWNYTLRNSAVLAGGGTTITGVDAVVRLEDLVTTLTEDDLGNPETAWRFVETVYNIQTKLYNLDVTFGSAPFSQSIVVDDDSTTQKQYAIRPKTVKAYAIKLVDQWIAEAWSRNRDSIVAGIVAEIDANNAGRINLLVPDVIAAGGKIYAIKYERGFVPAAE
jgi:phage tail sheath gpL-like